MAKDTKEGCVCLWKEHGPMCPFDIINDASHSSKDKATTELLSLAKLFLYLPSTCSIYTKGADQLIELWKKGTEVLISNISFCSKKQTTTWISFWFYQKETSLSDHIYLFRNQLVWLHDWKSTSQNVFCQWISYLRCILVVEPSSL